MDTLSTCDLHIDSGYTILESWSGSEGKESLSLVADFTRDYCSRKFGDNLKNISRFVAVKLMGVDNGRESVLCCFQENGIVYRLSFLPGGDQACLFILLFHLFNVGRDGRVDLKIHPIGKEPDYNELYHLMMYFIGPRLVDRTKEFDYSAWCLVESSSHTQAGNCEPTQMAVSCMVPGGDSREIVLLHSLQGLLLARLQSVGICLCDIDKFVSSLETKIMQRIDRIPQDILDTLPKTDFRKMHRDRITKLIGNETLQFLRFAGRMSRMVTVNGFSLMNLVVLANGGKLYRTLDVIRLLSLRVFVITNRKLDVMPTMTFRMQRNDDFVTKVGVPMFFDGDKYEFSVLEPPENSCACRNISPDMSFSDLSKDIFEVGCFDFLESFIVVDVELRFSYRSSPLYVKDTLLSDREWFNPLDNNGISDWSPDWTLFPVDKLCVVDPISL